MFTLLRFHARLINNTSGLWGEYTLKKQFAVVILGLDNSGKTTLLEAIKERYIKGYKRLKYINPTVGMNIGRIDMDQYKLVFWDLGGQTELIPLWEKYYAESHAIMFVVDSTDEQRIKDVLDTFEKVLGNDQVLGMPVLMIANKQDQPGAIPVHQVKEYLNPVVSKYDARESSVIGLSALNGEGVENAISWIYSRILRNVIEKPAYIAK